jgi:hypothetical protein
MAHRARAWTNPNALKLETFSFKTSAISSNLTTVSKLILTRSIMKTKFQFLLITLMLLASVYNVAAQGTAFSYQGRLNDGSAPASGSYDLVFTLYNTSVTSVPVAGPVTNNAVAVTNGLFTTAVDFGTGVFTGRSNWLQIAVSTNGANTFTTLAPRQQLTPVPNAIFAEGANAAGLSGTIAPANLANGSITSNLLATGSVGVPQLTTNIGVWTQVGTNLFYTNGYVSIGTTVSQSPLQVRGNGANNSAAIVGIQTTGSETGAGVFGFSQLPNGNGIRGEADVSGSDGGMPLGVWAISGATNGIALYAEAPNTSGPTFGVYSIDSSPQGFAGYFQGNGFFSGNVGIGTFAPDRPLAIKGVGGSGEWLSFQDTNGITRWHLNNLAYGLNFAQTHVADARLFLSTNGNVGIGTSSPASPLQVVGNIQMGAGGNNYAASGPENLRVVRGVVSPAGSIVSGGGFTVVSNNVGSFTINFTPGFSSLPAVTMSGASCIATWNSLNLSFVGIAIVSYGGTPLNQYFNFIAVGPP